MICDATPAAFAKWTCRSTSSTSSPGPAEGAGGEAAHACCAQPPRRERLESYTPARDRCRRSSDDQGGKLNEGIFKGETINKPSMLAVETLSTRWTGRSRIGGLPALQARSEANLTAIADWVDRTDWIDFLPADPAIRPAPRSAYQDREPGVAAARRRRPKGGAKKTRSSRGRGYCLRHHAIATRLRASGSGGATVETSDIEALLPWLDWAWDSVRQIWQSPLTRLPPR